MQIIHTIGGLHPRMGGPVRTVTRLAECLAAEKDITVRLLSQSLIGDTIFPTTEVKLDRQIAFSHSRRAIQFDLPLRKLVNDSVRTMPPSLIHDHGIWAPGNHFITATARRFNIPLVIHPRGMVEPWALEYRAWKKRLALLLYQRRNLKTVEIFIAASLQEAESLRRMGLKQPVAIIPNGVEIPNIGANYSKREVQSNTKRKAIFLSRIHPSKGLLNLVEAWSRVCPENWFLRIAGPDEGGHLAEIMRRVHILGLSDSIEYIGEVDGDAKASLFESADLFILPSFSENFGVVVAEALSYKVPVITTTGTPWEGLLENQCGWWIEPTTEALAETLHEVLSMKLSLLRNMGDKGYLYAKEFNWKNIACQTAEVYRWVLRQGPMPECVIKD